jgi:beta-lactamase regulating signal transducer with metallopeptidase domain/tetratricopeptide (TPR) repeat protein
MSATLLTSSPLWTAAGWTMLHLVWVGLAIGVMAALARRLLRSTRPEVRYGVALAWLMVLSVSPAVIFVRVFEPTSRSEIAMVRVVKASQPVSSGSSGISDLPPPGFRDAVVDRPISDLRRSRLDFLVPYLPWFWLSGSLSTLVMLATGLIGVEQFRRSSRLIEVGELPTRCRALADSLGIARRVGVGICDRLSGPILVGIIRPLILLPPAALSGWSVEQIEMVLLHELAHLRRWDNLVNLMQRVVESLLFFHPVVWWLSGWVRLERELCCDRLVVDRLGRPIAYVEMLMTVAGSSQTGRRAVQAMADRQVMTRIRRLLNLEDRSMKLTMPEGLGVLVGVIVGVSLALGSQAAPPKPAGESEESIRQALRKAVDVVVKDIPRNRPEVVFSTMALVNIAETQLKLGDRVSALVTLLRAKESIEYLDPKTGDVDSFEGLTEIAKYQREAGDLSAARATLDRLAKLVESIKDFSRIEPLVWLPGEEQPRRGKHEIGAILRCGLLGLIAEERLALGDRDEACLLYERAVEAIRPEKGVLKPMFLAGIGSGMYQAGDRAEAKKVFEQAIKAATAELTKQEYQEGAMPRVVQAMAEIGDLDRAINLAQSLGKHGMPAAMRKIVESFAEDGFQGDWFDPAGVKILIGAKSLKVRDRAATIRAMPKIARAVLDFGDTLLQVHTLSIISNLQASAGDFVGARQTADSIPNVKRKDFPGPSDGLYDAVKPATFAINARLQAEAGDKVGAREGLHRALALSHAIETPDQKIVAQIVIVQKQIDCGDLVGAKALLVEVIPFALGQSEPARSRSLAMLIESQAKVGDVAGATKTATAIRDYPGLEKIRALNIMANRYEEAGDSVTAKAFLSQALKCAEAEVPENAAPLIGKLKPPQEIASHSWAAYEYEINPRIIEVQKQMQSMLLRARLVDTEEAVRLTLSMPEETRNMALSNLAEKLARQGDVARAVGLAKSLETPQGRLQVFNATAWAIRDREVRK